MLLGPHSITPFPLVEVEEFSWRIQQAQYRLEQLRGRHKAGQPQAWNSDFENASAELSANLEELRVAEAELRQQNEELELSRTMLEYAQSRYKELFESAPDAYLVTDLIGTIREINTAAEVLVGIPAYLASGKPLAVLISPQQRRAFRTLLEEVALRETTTTWDFDLLIRGGITAPVSARIARTQPEVGQSAGVLWIIRDMSVQVIAEQQLRLANQELEKRVIARTSELEQILQRESRANRGKVEFLALLSHEIRTPLHALMAYTELIERGLHGPVTELQRKDLQRMRQGHDHILGLVSRILDFARLESGQVVLEIGNIPVSPLIRVVLDILQPKCMEKGISCREMQGPEKAVVRADMEALRQILINLIGNAIKFNVPQGIVEISWEQTEDRIGIHVRDTGPGIAPNNLDFVFEPFTQVLKSTRDRSGTGLGLPISRALAQSMQGSLEVQSVLNEGSIFSLWLPVVPNGEGQ